MTRFAITRLALAGMSEASVDERGVRFEHEGRILRALSGAHADLIEALLESPYLESIFEAGLVRFWKSDVIVESSDLVIECERVPVVSYPQEWPTVMLYEAGLMIARLGQALAQAGVGLHDAHPWNVLFAGTRPVWVDIGSLVPLSNVTDPWVDEFRRHIVLPLALRSSRWQSMADAVWADHPGTGAKRIWEARPLRRSLPFGYARLARGSRQPRSFYARLESYLDHTKPTSQRGEWSSYVQSPGNVVGDASTYGPKQRAVDAFLTGQPRGTVLDAGANVGWFTELAVSHGHTVIALDTDDRSLCALHDRSRVQGHPVLALKVDMMWPLGSHGLLLSHRPAHDRLKSDVTLWLAVVHHLAGRQGYRFDAIARSIDMFTKRRAIVEFIPREDVHLRDWPRAREPWWDVDHFVEAMRPYFPNVETKPSAPAPRLMLCFTRDET